MFDCIFTKKISVKFEFFEGANLKNLSFDLNLSKKIAVFRSPIRKITKFATNLTFFKLYTSKYSKRIRKNVCFFLRALEK